MDPTDSTAWDTALERLLDDVYTFAMAGPRHHGDWARDVLAVMDRSVTDPRGWRTLEWGIDKEGRENGRPAYPFLPPTAEQVRAWTYPVTAGAAAELLASLTQEWFLEGRPVRARADRNDVLADARTVLGRFGAGAVFRTSAERARASASPEFLAADLAGGRPFTHHVMDLGLIAVGADEVGVFWSFNANG
ncbi:hypothetical protein NX801_09140 [Streptomyces sp. LP05-1]|uniref:Uncharacterized protein n=1 Tax=Streptomyces pyxinae TaxID=2970734 RepID=A0ABT2CEL7_9ACTN|nr:hypothetical protein [Streptomyces sp. LP05-1]MCS0635828.1 hypothetical protein [Streptomyces sp. LP05-1]